MVLITNRRVPDRVFSSRRLYWTIMPRRRSFVSETTNMSEVSIDPYAPKCKILWG